MSLANVLKDKFDCDAYWNLGGNRTSGVSTMYSVCLPEVLGVRGGVSDLVFTGGDMYCCHRGRRPITDVWFIYFLVLLVFLLTNKRGR